MEGVGVGVDLRSVELVLIVGTGLVGFWIPGLVVLRWSSHCFLIWIRFSAFSPCLRAERSKCFLVSLLDSRYGIYLPGKVSSSIPHILVV